VLIPRAKMIVLCWFKEPSRSSIASTYQLLCHRLWLDGYKKLSEGAASLYPRNHDMKQPPSQL